MNRTATPTSALLPVVEELVAGEHEVQPRVDAPAAEPHLDRSRSVKLGEYPLRPAIVDINFGAYSTFFHP